MKKQNTNKVCLCMLLAVVCMVGACASMQARSTKTSGFLGDYSQLKKGGDDKALLCISTRKPI